MSKTFRLLGSMIFCVYLLPSLTAQPQISRSNQQWIQYYHTFQFDSAWSLHTDGGFRVKNQFQNASQYIIRTGLGYTFKNDMRLVAGFAQLGFWGSEGINKWEFRPYQELGFGQEWVDFKLSHRFRLEERFFTSALSQDEKRFALRFRYRLLGSIPLSAAEHAPAILIGDEIFLHAGKGFRPFDQNRLIIGLQKPFSDRFAINLVYNHQYSSGSEANQFRQTYVFWLGIKHLMHPKPDAP
ncbi:MAG: DUF2490 domain-containing protein [Bacteroidota bacterium]